MYLFPFIIFLKTLCLDYPDLIEIEDFCIYFRECQVYKAKRLFQSHLSSRQRFHLKQAGAELGHAQGLV